MKLKKFEEFTATLFPHEVDYLLSVQQFTSAENVKILKQIAHNINFPEKKQTFDLSLDKRRYSNLKKWIEEKLESVDVDVFLKWMLDLDEKIITDKISREEEQFLIQKIQQVKATDYYFARFYEMVEHYRDYLLIRVRKRYYEPVFRYLNENYLKYIQAVEINKQLNQATKDIVQFKKTSETELLQWQLFLHETLKNPHINGDSRYKALIRLSLLFYRKRDFTQLESVFDFLDEEFKGSTFYSKRILANFYANRSMVLAKTGKQEQAEKYAYLSVKIQNNDYFFYINNLIYILHEHKKYSEALKIACQAIPLLKRTNSFYNQIGFTALYIRSLNHTNQSHAAVSYAQSFFEAYKKEIFDFRWHLFFTAFFEALLLQEKYEIIINYCKRYQLVKRERTEQNLKSQNNIIYWFFLFSAYMTAQISEQKVKSAFRDFINNEQVGFESQERINRLTKDMQTYFPDFIRFFNQSVPKEEFIF